MPPEGSENPIAAEERQRGVGRIVSFSDAVVAIAATLLVLPLVDAAADIGHESVGDLLSDNASSFLVFVLSFAVICRFWLVHHSMYEHVADYTPELIMVNFVWLLSIVFLPFSTQLIGTAPHRNALIYLLYIGTMFVTTAASAVGQWIIVHTPKIESADARASTSMVPASVATATMGLALILAVTVPQVGIWWLLLLFLTGAAENVIARRRRRRTNG